MVLWFCSYFPSSNGYILSILKKTISKGNINQIKTVETIWISIYWFSYAACYIVLPFFSYYWSNGHFEKSNKIKYCLYMLALYYAVIAPFAIGALIYFFLIQKLSW